MLHSSQIVMNVAESLKKIKAKRIILDPVMIAKGGAKLIDNKAIQTLKKKLIGQVSLITPNIPEAEVLTKIKIKNLEDMIRAANILIKFGVRNVLLKGGHRESKYICLLYTSPSPRD